MKGHTLAGLVAALVCPAILGSAPLLAQTTKAAPTKAAPATKAAPTAQPAPTTKPAAPQTAAPTAAREPLRPYFPPVRGTAALGFLKPVVKVDRKTKEVITTIKVKNLSSMGSIASLRCEGFWYDKQGNLLPGGSKTLRQPLNPGEVQTLELRTQWLPAMFNDQYRFTHGNGEIQAKLLATIP